MKNISKCQWSDFGVSKIGCPVCGGQIPVSVVGILSCLSITCPFCGLVLSVDKEGSRQALDIMNKVKRNIDAAKQKTGVF